MFKAVRKQAKENGKVRRRLLRASAYISYFSKGATICGTVHRLTVIELRLI